MGVVGVVRVPVEVGVIGVVPSKPHSEVVFEAGEVGVDVLRAGVVRGGEVWVWVAPGPGVCAEVLRGGATRVVWAGVAGVWVATGVAEVLRGGSMDVVRGVEAEVCMVTEGGGGAAVLRVGAADIIVREGEAEVLVVEREGEGSRVRALCTARWASEVVGGSRASSGMDAKGAKLLRSGRGLVWAR